MSFLPAELIKKKRAGNELTRDELQFLIEGYVAGSIPDYQMSAWLMAVFFRGMTDDETWTLTELMMNSGHVFKFPQFRGIVDKHSTGGVGDKTSLILAPIVAAAGLKVPMIAGRGLGHTGGTIDKLESIPGFSVALTREKFTQQLANLGVALIGQTEEICPADKKIYGLRDVTATVESLPLICASIMSKKLAEGIETLVLDVKCGSGAFMKTEAEARALAAGLKRIGQLAGKSVTAFITDMNEPLGRLIGNSVEVEECLAILRREDFRSGTLHSISRREFSDCEKLSVQLAGEMIHLCGVTRTRAEGIARAQEILESGGAYSAFQDLIQQQGGQISRLPTAQVLREVTSPAAGIMDMNCEAIGYAGIALKAGRAVATDILDPQAGLQILIRRGERVDRGQPVFRIFGGPQTQNLDEAERRLLAALQIRDPGALSGDELARLQQSLQNRKNGDLILGEV